MSNVKTIKHALGVTTTTEMKVNKKGAELGWRQQFKAVTVYNSDSGMPCETRTKYYWQNGEFRHTFKLVQK